MKIMWLFYILILSALSIVSAQSKINSESFENTNSQDSCTFLTSGRNMFFILEPGYQLILEGKDGKDSLRLVITVLNQTKKIGNVETRIIEENETKNGKTAEISRNYFAICKQTGDIYYFGEEVDIYKNGKIINHDGAWIAEGKNKQGVVMPGVILVGAKYYLEKAPGIAMDMAEIISTSEVVKTYSGYFINCLKTEETSELKPKEKEYKYYAEGVGLIKDDNLLLVKHGFVKKITN